MEIEEGLKCPILEQVKVSWCMIIRSVEGDGSSLHHLKKKYVVAFDVQSIFMTLLHIKLEKKAC